MSTSLFNCEILLSKQLNDYWASTTTSAGGASGESITDTALTEKTADWITDETYNMILTLSVGAYTASERKVKELIPNDGILGLTRAHAAQIATSIAYRIHRLFSGTEKQLALVAVVRDIYPSLFEEIWDETLVTGNWLKDGSFERWDDANTLTDWTDDGTVILTKTETSPYYKHGATSCKLGTAAGMIHQDVTNFDDLKHLAGKTATFTLQGHCATADTLRIAIYDGTTETFSSYRTAEAAWTKNNDPMSVQATIQDNPTAIEFRTYLDTANDAYIDDARVISDYRSRLYIRHLGLVQDRPHQVFIEPSNYSQEEDWIKITDYKIDKDGYLYIPTTYPSDYRLRIRGIKYLDFLDSSGDSGTDWEDTIAIDEPQLQILVAHAALYLCNQKIGAVYTSGESDKWKELANYWRGEIRERQAKYSMVTPPATIHWGIE